MYRLYMKLLILGLILICILIFQIYFMSMEKEPFSTADAKADQQFNFIKKVHLDYCVFFYLSDRKQTLLPLFLSVF